MECHGRTVSRARSALASAALTAPPGPAAPGPSAPADEPDPATEAARQPARDRDADRVRSRASAAVGRAVCGRNDKGPPFRAMGTFPVNHTYPAGVNAT